MTTSKYYIPSGRCVQAIDYKHRNEDGSVGTIPDSLTKVFHTAAGREVRDGGGVMPDIVIKQEKLPNILFYLVRDNLIFDYATQYCLKHPTIVAPEKFEVTDADYNDFKALVKKADFKYDQQSEKEDFEPDEADTVELLNGERMPWEQVKRDGIDYIALYYVNEKGKPVQILDAELA